MKIRWLVPVLMAGCLAWSLHGVAPQATPQGALRGPSVVVLEGDPEGADTDVVVRAPGAHGQATRLGRVTHAAGSALRAVVLPGGTAPVALLVAAEGEGARGSTYNSALFRVGAGSASRLLGGLTDASAPLVTARGAVLVQRGSDGVDAPRADGDRTLRERTDALSLDVVDPATGAARAAWTGTGQIAFLATALRDDEVVVFHVDDAGGHLFVLDAASGATRTLAASMLPLARDFSYDPAHDEVVFARAAALGSDAYEVVALAAHGAPGAPRVLYRADNPHLMPRALHDGVVALSLPGDRGLGLLERSAATPRRVAPVGDGSDAVLAETRDGAWLAVRHTERQREVLAVVERATGRAATLDAQTTTAEFVGFVPAVGGAP